MRQHVQILAILNIVWGSIGFLAALIILLVFGGAVGIIGMASQHDPDARIAIPIIGLVGSIIILGLVLTSLPSIVAGIGLLRLAPWARILTIVLSAVHLFSIPFGTALGIYGLWVLLSNETPPIFEPAGKPIRI
jgi:hypothetical protein